MLDIGSGEGALAMSMDTVASKVVSFDSALPLLDRAPAPKVLAAVTALPFAEATFDAVVTVNVLDHLPSPTLALREAERVLRPVGFLIAACISRFDSPELHEVWRPAPTPFDAEDAPTIVAGVFDHVQVKTWDAPLIQLPDRPAVRDYLLTRFVPAPEAERASRRIRTPLIVTKGGVLIIASNARLDFP